MKLLRIKCSIENVFNNHCSLVWGQKAKVKWDVQKAAS
jgi:hypothetical protein